MQDFERVRDATTLDARSGGGSMFARRRSIRTAEKKPEAVRKLLLASLKANHLFARHEDDTLNEIVEAMEERTAVNKDVSRARHPSTHCGTDAPACATRAQVVIKQGQKGDAYYIIERGRFYAQVEGAEAGSGVPYAAGDSFGELALLYDCRRAATVRCLEAGVLWALGREQFRKLVMGNLVQEESAETQPPLDSRVASYSEKRTPVNYRLATRDARDGRIFWANRRYGDVLLLHSELSCSGDLGGPTYSPPKLLFDGERPSKA
jgi:CRP-like cAMP-binding protein